MKKNFVVTATGDSLFTADFPKEYDADLSVIKNYIGKGKVLSYQVKTNQKL